MKKNNFSFSYTDYKTFGHKIKKISNPPKINYFNFIKSTSIATSTMMIKRSKIVKKQCNHRVCYDCMDKWIEEKSNLKCVYYIIYRNIKNMFFIMLIHALTHLKEFFMQLKGRLVLHFLNLWLAKK